MLKLNWKTLLFFLVWVFVIGSPAEARTLADSIRERNEARADSEAAHRARDQAYQEKEGAIRALEQRRAEERQKIQEKGLIVEIAKQRLRTSKEIKVNQITQELAILQEQSREINRITWIYLQNQKEQSQIYNDLIRRFQEYQRLEVPQKDKLLLWIDQARAARNPQELVPLREGLYQLNKYEQAAQSKFEATAQDLAAKMRNTHAEYERRITPYESFMREHQFPKMPAPQRSIVQLESVRNYSHQRGEYFSNQYSQRMHEIESQMNSQVQGQVTIKGKEQEKRNIHTALKASFSETVRAILRRANEISAHPEPVRLGCGEKLKPYYDLYREVLTYKDHCTSVEGDQSSPDYLGCLMLKPVFEEAANFFGRNAWSKMNLTLLSTRVKAPESTTALVERLSELKAKRQQESENLSNLLEAIEIHDDLLDQWRRSL